MGVHHNGSEVVCTDCGASMVAPIFSDEHLQFQDSHSGPHVKDMTSEAQDHFRDETWGVPHR